MKTQTQKQTYTPPTLKHQGGIDQRTLGEFDLKYTDTGGHCPYCYKDTKPEE